MFQKYRLDAFLVGNPEFLKYSRKDLFTFAGTVK